jgi:AcrR family transcriptional regulator
MPRYSCAAGSAPAQPISTALQDDRESTRRERLLSAMIDVATTDGYAAATVARVVVRAGVSRPSFYEHFIEKEDCFLAALAGVQEQMLAQVTRAVRGEGPEQAAGAAVAALIDFADSKAAMGRLAMSEALAGGPRALDARDRGIEEIARTVEQAFAQVPAGRSIPDVPLATTIGAVQRLLASRLRRGERGLARMQKDLLGWLSSYEQPAGEHRWRTLAPSPPPARSSFVARIPLRAPPPPAPGRARLSEGRVAENQRQRIVFATAELVARKGYAATTVAEIAKHSKLDGRVFYRLFADKQDAFAAVHELAFQRTMAVTAGAFFAGGQWPERVWEAGRAFTQFIAQNPTLTHASLIEGHAGDPARVQRLEDLLGAFTIFLQEGYEHGTHGAPPTRLAVEAIAAANFEIVYRQARWHGATADMAGLLTHLSHICLAPFLGSARANELIDELTGAERSGIAR